MKTQELTNAAFGIFYVCYLLFHSFWIYFTISRPAQILVGFARPTDHFHQFFTYTGHNKLNTLIKQVKYCFSDI